MYRFGDSAVRPVSSSASSLRCEYPNIYGTNFSDSQHIPKLEFVLKHPLGVPKLVILASCNADVYQTPPAQPQTLRLQGRSLTMIKKCLVGRLLTMSIARRHSSLSMALRGKIKIYRPVLPSPLRPSQDPAKQTRVRWLYHQSLQTRRTLWLSRKRI